MEVLNYNAPNYDTFIYQVKKFKFFFYAPFTFHSLFAKRFCPSAHYSRCQVH